MKFNLKSIGLLILVFIIGCICSGIFVTNIRESKIQTIVSIEHDTTYAQIHDTCFIDRTQRILRNDTVLLARVDTILNTDSIFVEVPIEEKQFDGEHYSILTEGFRVKLKSVDIEYPTITKTVTNTITKQKHWSGSIGVQAGYGITIHGASPYAGVGVGFGYTF